MKLRLEFEVDYEPNGVSQETLAYHALNEGLLTGDSPAEVSTWLCHVRDLETGEVV